MNTTKVTIIKQKGLLLGLSPVFDYIHRPQEIEDMNLHDWIRCCRRRKKEKVNQTKTKTKQLNNNIGDSCSEAPEQSNEEENHTTKKKSTNLYDFTEDHPLHSTHETILLANHSSRVANFIGKPLPRCDQGDREYYCLTMLVLFKPWRQGTDLKDKNLTWDETFISHHFTPRQQQLMQNFNIRYECLDAKDDYHSQRKQGMEKITALYGKEMQNDADQLHETEDDGNNLNDLFVDESGIVAMGKLELKRQRDAAEIRSVMQQTGWTTGMPQDKSCKYDAIQIVQTLCSTDWNSKVQELKLKILTDRQTRGEPQINSCNPSIKLTNINAVKIIDRSYLEKKYYTTQYETRIDEIRNQFQLNCEQERAFKIITHHSIMPHSDHLKMYIGGMGGTGKSQVIKAISAYFMIQNEEFQFMIVAPTGSAAALLGGSTYHSAFGINDKNGATSMKLLAQIKARLNGVNYVFLDEVSMISAHELYKISVQLCKVMNRHDIPFGGMNMIFAGDFAQLPPPMGGENVSLYSRTIGLQATSVRAQEEAIGRGIWHQFTTVVILRKNMRQKGNTKEDNKLRTALENMRYKDCTLEDIHFLRSRITSLQPGRPSICSKEFKNTAMITAKNVQKDEINRLGCIKFAMETNQNLIHFYSEDNISTNQQESRHKKTQGRTTCKAKNITTTLQNLLWQLPHSTADKHIAGKLSLCIGMPVMIKCNVATELCMTNGQEGTLAGWQSCLGSKGQQMIETIFIQLLNPPNDIHIDGLPKNITPISCTTNSITCTLPDDQKIQISRKQVEILPNFAMTDFASQGKTRPWNPVHLNNCRSHQAYYTALSRSATAHGTIILQGFDSCKITGRASGALHQEFRDLELLDEITKLKYEGKLNKTVRGETRNTLIHTYRAYRGINYVPSCVHKSIKWTEKDPMLDPINNNNSWKILDHTKNNLINNNTENITMPKKRKKEPDHICEQEIQQQPKQINHGKISQTDWENMENHTETNKRKHETEKESASKKHVKHRKILIQPQGITWDNNSCAYDATVTILYNIWAPNPTRWSHTFNNINQGLLGMIQQKFTTGKTKTAGIENARNALRETLAELWPTKFPWKKFTSIHQLWTTLLTSTNTTVTTSLECINKHQIQTGTELDKNCSLLTAGTTSYTSINEWINNFKEETNHACTTCQQPIFMQHKLQHVLPLIAFDLSGHTPWIDKQITTHINGENIEYTLKGIAYYGNHHFTCQIITEQNTMWFHDGILTGNDLIEEGQVFQTTSLNMCREKEATLVIYTLS
jgi:hypothetical protein